MEEIIIFLNSAGFAKYGWLIFFGALLFFNLYLLLALLGRKKSWSLPLPEWLHRRWLVAVIDSLLLLGVLGFSGMAVSAHPQVIFPNSPSLEAVEITRERPFRVIFDRPIDRDKMTKSITPEIPGTWSYSSSHYLLLTDTLTFTPEVSPAAEARYTISLGGIKNLLDESTTDYLLSFVAPPLPTIVATNPSNGAQDVLPGQEIFVETDFSHESLARFEFKLKPETEIEVTKTADRRYSLKPKGGLRKGTSYSLEAYRIPVSKNFADGSLEDAGETALVSQLTFRTIAAPGVADYGPKGSGLPISGNIWIDFRQEMDGEATGRSFSITPNPGGNLSWESGRRLNYRATLAKNTTYTVKLTKTAKAADGTPFEDDFNYSFTTIGYVGVSGFSPSNKATGISTAAKVSVTFNQAVDHASAQSKFSITPNVAGAFSWSGNTLTYRPSGFAYGTRYTVNVAGGVKTINGLDSNRDYSASFTTQQQSVTLKVPAYRQAHMYSCMATAARSALAYKGVYPSENTLLGLIGYDKTAYSGTWRDPNSIWGNPYAGIVGNVDGKSGGVSWGYGAYWGPTAKAISTYRPAEVKTGWNVSGIAGEIAGGNPVLIWWVNGVWPAYEVYWKTPTGTSIRGVNSMHVQVVKGFTGTVANPTSFTVTDSGYGYPGRTYDIGTFKAKWGWFGNSAVIVR